QTCGQPCPQRPTAPRLAKEKPAMKAATAVCFGVLLVCGPAGSRAGERPADSGAVGASSCRAVQLAAQAAVEAGGPYRNHGDLVRTAAHIVNTALKSGAINDDCAGCIISQFARGVPITDQKPCSECQPGALTVRGSGVELLDPSTLLTVVRIANQ